MTGAEIFAKFAMEIQVSLFLCVYLCQPDFLN